MEKLLSVFEISSGTRISSWTGEVLVNGQSIGPRAYKATATNRIKFLDGQIRRLFTDASIEFIPGVREIWLGDGPPSEVLKANARPND